jgi:hypothetical protein
MHVYVYKKRFHNQRPDYPAGNKLLPANRGHHRHSKERWTYFVRKKHQDGYQNHLYKNKVSISILG